jgi:predicted dehydrogenase
MTRTLRAGIIGLGMMGRNHMRVLQSLPDVELVTAVDPVDRPHHPSIRINVVRSVRELIDRDIDFCVVATPTSTHQAIALELAEAGVPTLIEKPLAHRCKAAQSIVEAFTRNGVLGCVGHIERFNPALQNMRRRLACGELGRLYQVVTRRHGPFPVRTIDTGVILDLATHDIDLTAWVTNSAYCCVSARVAHRRATAHEDLMSAIAELSSGIVVTHLASWLSPIKERVTTVTGELGCFVADTLTADLTFYQAGDHPLICDKTATFREVSEGRMIRYAIPKSDPLTTELSNFAAAVRGESAEIVTLQEGHAAVRVADALREAAATGETIEVAE